MSVYRCGWVGVVCGICGEKWFERNGLIGDWIWAVSAACGMPGLEAHADLEWTGPLIVRGLPLEAASVFGALAGLRIALAAFLGGSRMN